MDVKRAAIIGNPMFAFDPASADQKHQNAGASDTIKLDDLNLGMDYKQLMEYFDNLKESNAWFVIANRMPVSFRTPYPVTSNQ